MCNTKTSAQSTLLPPVSNFAYPLCLARPKCKWLWQLTGLRPFHSTILSFPFPFRVMWFYTVDVEALTGQRISERRRRNTCGSHVVRSARHKRQCVGSCSRRGPQTTHWDTFMYNSMEDIEIQRPNQRHPKLIFLVIWMLFAYECDELSLIDVFVLTAFITVALRVKTQHFTKHNDIHHDIIQKWSWSKDKEKKNILVLFIFH